MVDLPICLVARKCIYKKTLQSYTSYSIWDSSQFAPSIKLSREDLSRSTALLRVQGRFRNALFEACRGGRQGAVQGG